MVLCLFLVELCCSWCFFFFFNDTATTEIYTLSLHDALPISSLSPVPAGTRRCASGPTTFWWTRAVSDRKSTRLNSSHSQISYAVFCLKKKKSSRRRTAPHASPPFRRAVTTTCPKSSSHTPLR